MSTKEQAVQLARAIESNRIPGHLILFEEDDQFVGVVPVRNWQTCFEDALKLIPYDVAAVVVHQDPPPLELLENAAASCQITYNGTAHARPVRIIRIEGAQAAHVT